MITPHMNMLASHPFRFIDKSWIIQQYKKYDILDLLELTRSCEGDQQDNPEVFKDLSYKTYISGQVVPTCGTCFWCKERAWAIEQTK